MIPKSLSATAIQTAQACPARFKAENIDKAKGYFGTAALLGSTVHNALEMFVKCVYIDKTHEGTLELLIEFFKLSYVSLFGTSDFASMEFFDGLEMLEKWFKRTSFDGVRVVSCEVKESFDLPTSVGPITFNYIWDRFDEIGPGVFKVVDYKSNRWSMTSDDLQSKIQARVYGLAAAIKMKQENIPYTKIWVEFDLLRHNSVGRVFTQEDNLATWKFLLDTAEEIIAMDEDNPVERLNDQCNFCVRKASCEALKKNIAVGGIHTIGSIEDAIDLRTHLEWQKKGVDALLRELDAKILAEARTRDQDTFESSENELYIGVSRQRQVDAEMAERAIGPKLFDKYGGKSITMASIDKLLKGKELTDDQKKQLSGLIYYKEGNPSVKTKPKNPIDDD